jgi:hypothetical protein
MARVTEIPRRWRERRWYQGRSAELIVIAAFSIGAVVLWMVTR